MKKYIAFFFSLMISNAALSQPDNNIKGNVYALVIGISKYADKEAIDSLQFADRDAMIFADFLRSRAGGSVPEENISLLLNEKATIAAIHREIHALTTKSKEGDYVYIYFSGHGSLENITLRKNGYLICYDTPPVGFIGNSLSVNILNELVEGMSVINKAKVVVITDACHSGKLAGKDNQRSYLTAEQLRLSRNNEIRITSSAANETSLEAPDYDNGKGRGVFSYYLVNGLKGLADNTNDGQITTAELKNYIELKFKEDKVLKREAHVQNPVITGKDDFILSAVDKNERRVVVALARIDSISNAKIEIPSADAEKDLSALSAQEIFFELLKKESLEKLVFGSGLSKLPANIVALSLIDSVESVSDDGPIKSKLVDLGKKVKEKNAASAGFYSELATVFQDRGQEIINLYMTGDEAEMERREYYNQRLEEIKLRQEFIANNEFLVEDNGDSLRKPVYGYEVYADMFTIALKMIDPGNKELENLLKVKLHYFTGVAARLKSSTVKDSRSLISLALSEQKKALALEVNAAYIYNELGILNDISGNYNEAEKNYLKAASLSDSWTFPWSNLVGLYTVLKKYDKAAEAAKKAEEPGSPFQALYVNKGWLKMQTGNLSEAEELFRKSIRLNANHFAPYERLGDLYTTLTDYALADSFYTESATRRKGYQLDIRNPRSMRLPKPASYLEINDWNMIVTSLITDYRGLHVFLGGLKLYQNNDLEKAETAFKKLIKEDKKNPLAFHYLGRLLYDQGRWQEAEIILQVAIENYLPFPAFMKYCDSIIRSTDINNYFDGRLLDPGSMTEKQLSLIEFLSYTHYDRAEDAYLLVELYKTREDHHAAEALCLKLLDDTAFEKKQLYSWLGMLLDRSGRYADAERAYLDAGNTKLDTFYKKRIAQFPDRSEWYYKTGNYFFESVRKRPYSFIYDKKRIDPVTNKVINVLTKRFPKAPSKPISSNHYIIYPIDTRKNTNQETVSPYSYTEGIFYLSRAAGLMQDDEKALLDCYTKIGDLYDWQGLPDSALHYYKKAFALNEDEAGLRKKLIDACMLVFNNSEAFAQLDSLYTRKQISYSKELLLAKFNIHSGNFKRGETLLNECQKNYPWQDDEISRLRASLHLLSGRHGEALNSYKQQLTGNNADSAVILYSIARTYAKTGNKTEAWKWLDASLNKGFNYRYVLQNDPFFDELRRSAKWNKLVIKDNEPVPGGHGNKEAFLKNLNLILY